MTLTPRPRSGNNPHSRPVGIVRDSDSDNRMNNTPYYERNQRYEGPTHNQYAYQQRFNDVRTARPTAKDDETRAYAINLQLQPVELGIKANNGVWQQEFRGLGAFNHYFGLCATKSGLGYTLPDIWDGYFHITLAKFFSALSPDALEKAFEAFNPRLEDIPCIPQVVFQASQITRGSGENRGRDRKGIDFIVLSLDPTPETQIFYEKVQFLLEQIRMHAKTTDWNVTSLRGLHVTVRKYSNIDFPLEKIKTEKFPIEFRCSRLEIKQPREQAIERFRRAQNGRFQWWNGVTEINKKCSGCGARVMSDTWQGFCLQCGQYESVIPLWSTTGNNIPDHSLEKETNIQNQTLNELVRQVGLE